VRVGRNGRAWVSATSAARSGSLRLVCWLPAASSAKVHRNVLGLLQMQVQRTEPGELVTQRHGDHGTVGSVGGEFLVQQRPPPGEHICCRDDRPTGGVGVQARPLPHGELQPFGGRRVVIARQRYPTPAAARSDP
jgi:hypothetical protein